MLINSLVVVLIGLIFILFRNYLSRNRSNKELAELNEKLKIKNTENELLLKEVHHRVKNSLEIVSGLLELQAAQIDSPTARAVMLASQNRVQSMGIVHKKLYQRDNFATIEMKDYFISLIESIRESMNATDRIMIECAMNPLELDVDTAVPLGLIANELLTNALKYAFEPRQSGKIEMGLMNVNSVDQYVFYVSDNGKGMIRNTRPQGTGFGTELIQLLAKQLDGQLKFESDMGTKVSLYFKKKPSGEHGI
jgi:two-component sensor histidine kinase